MDVIDAVSKQKDQGSYKECLVAIRKRLNNRDPHVVMLALSVSSLMTKTQVQIVPAASRRVRHELRRALQARSVHARVYGGAEGEGHLCKWALSLGLFFCFCISMNHTIERGQCNKRFCEERPEKTITFFL